MKKGINNEGFKALPSSVQNNILSNMKYGGYGKKYAAGGAMPMEQLTEFNGGGRHEENSLGGIPQGMNPEGQMNLVEEGETKFDAENYIYSDSLKIDKELAEAFNLSPKMVGKTFADASKMAGRKKSKREGDAIEDAANEKDLTNLMEAQEAFKQARVEEKLQEIAELDPNALPALMGQGQPQGDPAMGGQMQEAPMDEQAMMEQQMMAEQGQPSPEEMAMMQQQQDMAMGQQEGMMRGGGDLDKILGDDDLNSDLINKSNMQFQVPKKMSRQFPVQSFKDRYNTDANYFGDYTEEEMDRMMRMNSRYGSYKSGGYMKRSYNPGGFMGANPGMNMANTNTLADPCPCGTPGCDPCPGKETEFGKVKIGRTEQTDDGFTDLQRAALELSPGKYKPTLSVEERKAKRAQKAAEKLVMDAPSSTGLDYTYLTQGNVESFDDPTFEGVEVGIPSGSFVNRNKLARQVSKNPTEYYYKAGDLSDKAAVERAKILNQARINKYSIQNRKGGKLCYGCGGKMHAYGGRMNGVQHKYGAGLQIFDKITDVAAPILKATGVGIPAAIALKTAGNIAGETGLNMQEEGIATVKDAIGSGQMNVKENVIKGGLKGLTAGIPGIEAFEKVPGMEGMLDQGIDMATNAITGPEEKSDFQIALENEDPEAIAKYNEMQKSQQNANLVNTGLGLAGNIAGNFMNPGEEIKDTIDSGIDTIPNEDIIPDMNFSKYGGNLRGNLMRSGGSTGCPKGQAWNGILGKCVPIEELGKFYRDMDPSHPRRNAVFIELEEGRNRDRGYWQGLVDADSWDDTFYHVGSQISREFGSDGYAWGDNKRPQFTTEGYSYGKPSIAGKVLKATMNKKTQRGGGRLYNTGGPLTLKKTSTNPDGTTIEQDVTYNSLEELLADTEMVNKYGGVEATKQAFANRFKNANSVPSIITNPIETIANQVLNPEPEENPAMVSYINKFKEQEKLDNRENPEYIPQVKQLPILPAGMLTMPKNTQQIIIPDSPVSTDNSILETPVIETDPTSEKEIITNPNKTKDDNEVDVDVDQTDVNRDFTFKESPGQFAAKMTAPMMNLYSGLFDKYDPRFEPEFQKIDAPKLDYTESINSIRRNAAKTKRSFKKVGSNPSNMLALSQQTNSLEAQTIQQIDVINAKLEFEADKLNNAQKQRLEKTKKELQLGFEEAKRKSLQAAAEQFQQIATTNQANELAQQYAAMGAENVGKVEYQTLVKQLGDLLKKRKEKKNKKK